MRFDDIHAAEQADRDIEDEDREDIVRYRSDLGLAVDDATVDYFLAEYNAGRHDGGMWLTDAEFDEQARIDALISEAQDAAEPYLKQHAEDFAGDWLGYGRPEYHVAFARNVEEHRAALARLVPRAEVLHVHSSTHTRAELRELQDRIFDDRDELAAAGVKLIEGGIDVETNLIELGIAAPDPDAAAALIRSRYGPAVTCEWLGQDDTEAGPAPWMLWSLDASERLLTVHFKSASEAVLDRATVSEDEREVRVTVYVRTPHIVVAIDKSLQATVELAQPLGNRRVVDGATGRVRKPRIPKELFDRSWELIRAYAAEHADECGGSWAEHPGCHVGFTKNVDAHRAALEAALPEPRALVVHEVARTEAELVALKDRIERDRRFLRGHGIRFTEPYIWIDDNVVFLEIHAEGDALRRFLTDRYGPALMVNCPPR